MPKCTRSRGTVTFTVLGTNRIVQFPQPLPGVSQGYYYIDFVILFLSFMYLRRIKNPEQLKYYSPGEFGKIMGLDRVPEAKCFRWKLAEICSQQKSGEWNMDLANQWALTGENDFYYIDGHVQVYNGYLATLGK